jgi:hypothetical protein
MDAKADCGFSVKVSKVFDAKNDADGMTDYFERGIIRVIRNYAPTES